MHDLPSHHTGLGLPPLLQRGHVNQLQHQGPPRHDPGPPGQEVPTDQALQHRALSTALFSQTYKHSSTVQRALGRRSNALSRGSVTCLMDTLD